MGEIADKRIKDFDHWINDLDANALTLWREAMEQLRQVHNDAWNGVRFFLTINGAILAAVFAIYRIGLSDSALILETKLILVFLIVVGIVLTAIALAIFGRHRDYNVQMFLLKTLLEDKLGFYDTHLHGVDLSFPWKVGDPEERKKAMTDPDKWKKDNKWGRYAPISRLLRFSYWFFIVTYLFVLLAVLFTV
jgi:hypothetical protein